MRLTVSYVAMEAYLPNAGNTLALTGIKSKCTYILLFGPVSMSSIIAVLMHERVP